MLAWSLTWASLNWLLDAASLWAFIAAFGSSSTRSSYSPPTGSPTWPARLPITPGGLGVVDSAAPLLLVGFGVTRSVATLGVIGWRLVNFWLPIPVGAVSYVSLKVKPGQGRPRWRPRSPACSRWWGRGLRMTRGPGRIRGPQPHDPAEPKGARRGRTRLCRLIKVGLPSDEAEEGQDRRAG